MALQPLALSLLGVDTPRGQEHSEEMANVRSSARSRRATSYYNPFITICTTSTDEPPSYQIAARQKPVAPSRERDILPKYTCTVSADAKVLVNIEAVSPLHDVGCSEWREVWVTIRGPLLSFYKTRDNGPGRILRSYTLQHAEVGLAPDVEHVILEPRTKLARLIPSAGRRRAWMKDPDLFEPVVQNCMRMRVETDQLVLATASLEKIYELIRATSAGIDISCSIDERSIPPQRTVPRRRRRHRHRNQLVDLADQALLAEQERILRDMYPALANESADNLRPVLGRTITTITAGTTNDSIGNELHEVTSRREEDEVDLSMIREEAEEDPAPLPSLSIRPARPGMLRSITDSSAFTTFSITNNSDLIYATAPENFSAETGKWQPPHIRTEAQIARYIQRCMPVLLPEQARASDILISNGKRMKVNYRMEVLEDWELQPPSYKSHHFAKTAPSSPCSSDEYEVAERTRSLDQRSTQDNAQASTSVLGTEGEDRIEPASSTTNLELTKVPSITVDKASANVRAKRNENRDQVDHLHGVVFCF